MTNIWKSTTDLAIGDVIRWQEDTYSGPPSARRFEQTVHYEAKVLRFTECFVYLELSLHRGRQIRRKPNKILHGSATRLETSEQRGELVPTARKHKQLDRLSKFIRRLVEIDDERERARDKPSD